ncbi:MAG TPA: Rieske (2Fe-2S) protein [Acetobacteraceae bacterium]|jgi:nitrite reductase/ring-hydroxylating ferredoxin subunit
MSTDVGAFAEFTDGRMCVIGVGGREIGIARWNGTVYAVSNRCPHQNGPVCAGILSGRLTAGAPGQLELDAEVPILACPWHGWEFDLRTGKALHDLRHRLHIFPVRVENGRTLVDLGTASKVAMG